MNRLIFCVVVFLSTSFSVFGSGGKKQADPLIAEIKRVQKSKGGQASDIDKPKTPPLTPPKKKPASGAGKSKEERPRSPARAATPPSGPVSLYSLAGSPEGEAPLYADIRDLEKEARERFPALSFGGNEYAEISDLSSATTAGGEGIYAEATPAKPQAAAKSKGFKFPFFGRKSKETPTSVKGVAAPSESVEARQRIPASRLRENQYEEINDFSSEATAGGEGIYEDAMPVKRAGIPPPASYGGQGIYDEAMPVKRVGIPLPTSYGAESIYDEAMPVKLGAEKSSGAGAPIYAEVRRGPRQEQKQYVEPEHEILPGPQSGAGPAGAAGEREYFKQKNRVPLPRTPPSPGRAPAARSGGKP